MNPIVGIGELLWDVYPDGRKVAGGAPFNFAFHCHQLGHPAAIVSRVGDDELGRELRARVRELGLSDEHIQTDPDHPTGTVQVQLGTDGVPTYTITENVAWDFLEWGERTARLMYRASAVCFGTLAQRGTVTPATLEHLLSNAYWFVGPTASLDLFSWADETDERPRVVVCDMNIRQAFYDVSTLKKSLRNSNWCKVNEEELALLTGVFDLGGTDDFAAPRSLAKLNGWGKHVVCLTRGANGCSLLVRRDEGEAHREEAFHEPGVPANVVDTVGAGDAFTAAMVCLHLEGRPLRECARFAVHYAARVCEHPGGTPRIDRAAVERAAGLR